MRKLELQKSIISINNSIYEFNSTEDIAAEGNSCKLVVRKILKLNTEGRKKLKISEKKHKHIRYMLKDLSYVSFGVPQERTEGIGSSKSI